MGFLKIITKADTDDGYLEACIDYVTTKHTVSYGGVNIRPEDCYNQMIAVKDYFNKFSGNQLVHFIVSFNNSVFTKEHVLNVSYQIAEYFKGRYQVIFGVHKAERKNKKGKVVSYFHTHFIMNSVSFVDGKKYADNKSDTQHFLQHIKHVTGDMYWKVRYGADSEICYDMIEPV